jgi:hypothetical protein
VLFSTASGRHTHRRWNVLKRKPGTHPTDCRGGLFRRHILDGVVRHGSLSRRQGEVAARIDYSSRISSQPRGGGLWRKARVQRRLFRLPSACRMSVHGGHQYQCHIMHHLCSYICSHLLQCSHLPYHGRERVKNRKPVIRPFSAAISISCSLSVDTRSNLIRWTATWSHMPVHPSKQLWPVACALTNVCWS